MRARACDCANRNYVALVMFVRILEECIIVLCLTITAADLIQCVYIWIKLLYLHYFPADYCVYRIQKKHAHCQYFVSSKLLHQMRSPIPFLL